MQADFLDAHERHWNDAEQLFSAQRWANSDHLYGFAAECGLKRLMQAFGMPIDQTTRSPKNREDLFHANKIWVRYEIYRSGKLAGADYMLPSTNPFANWAASDRYAHRANFDEAHAQGHQAGTKAVRELIKKAQLEGIL